MSSPLQALRQLADGVVALALTRAEQAGLELAQARAQLVRWAGLLVALALLATLALAAGSAWLTLLLWDRWGAMTLLLLALAYAAVAFGLLHRLRREVDAAPPLLAQTLADLARDRAALRAARGDQPPAEP